MPGPAACSAAKTAPAAEPVTAAPRRRGYPRNAAATARALVCQQLANGPKSGSQIEAAAESPERLLIATASMLGVRTQRVQ